MIINPKSYDKRLREDFSVEHHLEEYPLKFWVVEPVCCSSYLQRID